MTRHSGERLGAAWVVQRIGSDKLTSADVLEIRRAADLTRQSVAFSCQRAVMCRRARAGRAVPAASVAAAACGRALDAVPVA